jgi:hypothetical protein
LGPFVGVAQPELPELVGAQEDRTSACASEARRKARITKASIDPAMIKRRNEALLGVFLVPTFYTRHTMLQQALSIAVGLAAAIGLRMLAHWWLRRLRD